MVVLELASSTGSAFKKQGQEFQNHQKIAF